MTRAAAVVALAAALAGCAGSEDGGEEAGTATLTFAPSNGVRENPTLSDPLVGDIYGNVFLVADVTLTGPVEGAMQFGDVEMLSVDLSAAGAVSPPWSTPDLAPGAYVFLGFFDVDGNGADTREPDDGDPVTLPVTNEFTIVAGETTELDAVFDLVLN